MWYGKNDDKWDDIEPACYCPPKQLTLAELKAKIEAAELKMKLEQYFDNLLLEEQ